MFKAKDYLSGNLPADPAHLPVAVTDVRLVHNIGAQILKHSKLSRKEISDLLNSALKEESKAEGQEAVKTRKDGFRSWYTVRGICSTNWLRVGILFRNTAAADGLPMKQL